MVDPKTTECPHHHRWGSYDPNGPDVCQDCGTEVETVVSRHRSEIERLRAALKGYEVMLTHFENVFLKVQARLRKMHDQDPVEVSSHEGK